MTSRAWVYTGETLIGMIILSGCSQPLNDRLTLGGSYLSPTFQSHVDSTTDSHDHQNLLFSEPPNPRSAWSPSQYITPMDGVVHSYELIIHPPLDRDDPPRVYGRYPTVADVLNIQSTSWIEDLLITIDELGRSFIGTPYAIGYTTLTGKANQPITSPRHPWKRRVAGGWSTGYPDSKHSMKGNENE